MENNLYIIYMPRVAAALRELGFQIIKITPNKRKPQYDVYWFEDTPAFRAAISTAVEKAKK
jgi:hypothetical protein